MASELNEVLEYAALLDIYGELLARSQSDVLKLFYYDNIGLTEQAEIKGVSRQAINDCLIKGQKALKNFENKLRLCSILKRAKATLTEAQFKQIFKKEGR